MNWTSWLVGIFAGALAGIAVMVLWPGVSILGVCGTSLIAVLLFSRLSDILGVL